MPLTLLEPFNLDTTANYTFNSANITANIAAGNLAVTGVSNLGAVGNVVITGGSNGQVLTTNGSGGLSWTTVAGGGSNISNGNSNVSIATANGNITMSVAGNANILTITGTGIVVSGNSNLGSNANVTITGGNAGQVLSTDGAGNLSWAPAAPAGAININPVTTGNAFIVFSNTTSGAFNAVANASISANIANGAVIANTFVGMLANGNSDVNIPSANGNIIFDVAGTANIASLSNVGLSVGSGSLTRAANVNANVPLYVVSNIDAPAAGIVIHNRFALGYSSMDFHSSGNLFMGSVGGANPSAPLAALANTTYLYATANTSSVVILAANASGAVRIGGANTANVLVVTGTGANITGTGNFSGNLSAANANLGNIASANFLTGVLTTASQPNITSVGTLGSLTVTGNITAGNANLGNAARANFFIGDGSLLTNIAVASGSIANGTSDVTVPVANGNIVFDVAGVANVMTVTSTGISNTRINLRVANNGATTSGNITPNASLADQFNFIGLTGAVNIAIPSGTFIDGQKLLYRFKDDGNARTLNWTGGANGYRAIGVNLPSTTSANKVLYVGCVYNSQDNYWDVVSVGQET